MADIENFKKEYELLLQQLSDPELISNWEKFEELNKRRNFLEKIVEKDKEIKELESKIEENKDILKAKEDPELISLAESETSQLKEKQEVSEKELEDLLKGGETKEAQSAIVEIRAGAGGQEAALFAGDLFRMYSRYAQDQGWQQKTLDSHATEIGGFKEIIFELKPARNASPARSDAGGPARNASHSDAGGNGDVFSKLKYEGGVHRVQRIPSTEKNGRVHTSTASVAILAKPKNAKLKIRTDDLKIDTFRSSGPGGQNVNRRETAIRITHLPTGIVVTSQTVRNQLQNKENAMAILEARILEKKAEAEAEKRGDKRKTQIGRAKRAEKIRTYNFPQDRVTDHRIKKNWHDIEGIMQGKLDPIIETLEKSEV